MGVAREAYLVDAALKAAGVPIAGVSIADPADRSTWTVQLLDGATKDHEATAAALIQSVDVSAPAADDVQTKDRLADPFTVALVGFLAEHFKLTDAQVRDELMAGLKASRKAGDLPADTTPAVAVLPGP